MKKPKFSVGDKVVGEYTLFGQRKTVSGIIEKICDADSVNKGDKCKTAYLVRKNTLDGGKYCEENTICYYDYLDFQDKMKDRMT